MNKTCFRFVMCAAAVAVAAVASAFEGNVLLNGSLTADQTDVPSWWNLSGEKERVVLESSGGPNGAPAVRFVINDGVNNNFPKANSIVGTSDWTHYAYEHTAGPQANAKTPAYVRIRIDGAAGTAWIDDVRIEEIAAPAAHR